MEKKSNYDLMSVVMVYLGNTEQARSTHLLRMLNTLLSEEIRAAEKLDILSNEYRIPRGASLEKEVHTMCNLSQGVEERGIAKGLAKGLEQGLEQGLEKGKQEGLITAVMNMMSNLKLPLEEALVVAGIPESEREDYSIAIGKLTQ